MKQVFFLIILSITILLNTGCSKDSKATARDQQIEIENYLKKEGLFDDAIQMGDTLWYIIEAEGMGVDSPNVLSTVTVHYEGKLLDGTTFDSSRNRGKPFTSSLQNVIAGWQIGLPLFKKGEKRKLFILSEYGYGNSNQGSIPRNSVLIYDIELLDFD